MRKVTLFGLLLGALVVGCQNKTPTGPSTVTVQQVTTTTTTTSVPGGVTTTTAPPTTTTVAPTQVARRYIGASGNPVLPNELTLVIQLVAGTARFSSMLDRLVSLGSDEVSRGMASYTVSGVYRTPAGGGGTVQGSLDGTLDSGNFSGSFKTEQPGCTAEREFSGILTASSLQWTGGPVQSNCKDNPLSFSSLTMVRGDTGLPPTTSLPTTSLQPCTYGLNPGGATIGLPGGSGSVQVVTQQGCGWSAQSFVPWVTVQPASGAAGPGAVQYTVAASQAPRQATLVIAGLPFVLRQEPPPATTTTSAVTTSSIAPSTTTVPSTSTVATTTTITTTTTIPTTTTSTTSTTTTTTIAGIPGISSTSRRPYS